MLAWIAFGFLCLFVTIVTLFNFLDLSFHAIYGALLIVFWVLGIIALLFLFSGASRYFILKSVEEKEIEEAEKNSAPPPSRTEKHSDHLDLQAIAKKIARRAVSIEKPEEWGTSLLKLLSTEIEIMAGIVYMKDEKKRFTSIATYAYPHAKAPYSFQEGEGIPGEAVKNKQISLIRNIPGDYTKALSGLGSGSPSYLVIIPLELSKSKSFVIELAGFRFANENIEQLFQLLSREIISKFSSETNQQPGKAGAKEETKGEKDA